ncbi:MAG: cytochrome c [Rhodocyclaceae bacterium]|nr:cytochrome c [Rhodocyclaceae bacterium]
MSRSNAPCRHLLAALATAFLTAHAASAPGNPSAADAVPDPVALGRSVASFCANCHGAAGISKYPDVPNLAGQNPAYLLRQVDAFASGKRQSEFMNGLMKVLSSAERQGLAAYYATLNVVPTNTHPGPGVAEGARAFAKICARCHGDDALGDDEHPRLAGQQAEYLRINMQRYYRPTKVRFYAPMTAAMSQLGQDNMEAVVQYLSSLNTH